MNKEIPAFAGMAALFVFADNTEFGGIRKCKKTAIPAKAGIFFADSPQSGDNLRLRRRRFRLSPEWDGGRRRKYVVRRLYNADIMPRSPPLDARDGESPAKPPDGIPPLPGVYRFVDGGGAALYVGKAANLKKRVASYFHRTRHSPRIRLMLAAMRDVEITVAASEHAALLLENSAIKALRPRYNILFRDDKSYPRLRLTAHSYPRLMFARGEARDGASFGPFPDSGAVRETINMLQRVFRLRTCADSVFANRARPCLLHGIGRCSAPCVNAVSPSQYAADVRGAKTLLCGDSRGVEADMRARMEDAAGRLEFERAAVMRDRLRALAVMRARHFVDDPDAADADYVGAHVEGGDACVNVVMVRGGRRLGERRFFPDGAPSATVAEILAAFIGQHYGGMENPPIIVAAARPDPPPPKSLPVVSSPRGAQKRRAEEAARNAAVALSLRRAKRGAAAEKLRALGAHLRVPPPARIECFDISHSAGELPTAARAVFIDGAAQTSQYRRYAISAKGGDDAAAIGEAAGRCYRRAVSEKSPLPDLLLIDGGIAQLRAAKAALPEAAKFPVLAVAKGEGRKPGRETLIAGDGEILRLSETDPAFHLILEVRDEAHRFAADGHRRRRDKKRRTSVLEEIDGVGPKLRRALIGYFGGLRGLRAAGEEELIKIRGVSPRLAKRIYDSLHE
ncbi:MAG: excinuclease ABC subunit UvrC [Gammaproteobacteria bacterium]